MKQSATVFSLASANEFLKMTNILFFEKKIEIPIFMLNLLIFKIGQ